MKQFSVASQFSTIPSSICAASTPAAWDSLADRRRRRAAGAVYPVAEHVLGVDPSS